MEKKLTAISLFAGVGGICLGFKNAGVDVIWANDMDKNACITYRENFGDIIVEDKIENIDEKKLPNADLVLFGFPCTSFSVAGYRKGFDDENSGHLFFEALRIIKHKRPKAFLLENVKNLVGHDGGNTYNVIYNSLKDTGYHMKAFVLNSLEYGNVPQNRERIYVVGFADEEDCKKFEQPQPKPLSKTIHDITEPHIKKDEKFYYENSKYYPMLKEHMTNKDTVYQLRRVYVRENKNNVSPTLTANMGTGGHNVPLIIDDFGIRKLTPRECFLLQGFPSEYKLPKGMANSHLYKQAGNSVTVSVVELIAKNMVEVLGDKSNIDDIEQLTLQAIGGF